MLKTGLAAALLILFAAQAAHAAPAQTVPAACNPPLLVPPALSGRVTALCGISAPGDLQAMPDGRHLLIAEAPGYAMAPGSLAVLDTVTDAVATLPRPRDAARLWGDPGCADRGEAAPFYPHGIELGIRRGGALQLLVVDHAAGEHIEFYQLMRHAGTWVAAWRGCVANPGPGMFNDVAATPAGGFVATVMFEKTAVYNKDGTYNMAAARHILGGGNSGYLMAWQPGQALRKLPGSDASFNNGVQVGKDGKTAYFTAWTGRQLASYDIAGGRITSRTTADFSPDKLSVAPDGRYITAGLPNPLVWFACLQKKSVSCDSGFTVAQWTPATGGLVPLLVAPAGMMSGAAVAVRMGDALYIGSFAGDRLLRVKLPSQAEDSHSR